MCITSLLQRTQHTFNRLLLLAEEPGHSQKSISGSLMRSPDAACGYWPGSTGTIKAKGYGGGGCTSCAMPASNRQANGLVLCSLEVTKKYINLFIFKLDQSRCFWLANKGAGVRRECGGKRQPGDIDKEICLFLPRSPASS